MFQLTVSGNVYTLKPSHKMPHQEHRLKITQSKMPSRKCYWLDSKQLEFLRSPEDVILKDQDIPRTTGLPTSSLCPYVSAPSERQLRGLVRHQHTSPSRFPLGTKEDLVSAHPPRQEKEDTEIS